MNSLLTRMRDEGEGAGERCCHATWISANSVHSALTVRKKSRKHTHTGNNFLIILVRFFSSFRQHVQRLSCMVFVIGNVAVVVVIVVVASIATVKRQLPLLLSMACSSTFCEREISEHSASAGY